MRPGATIGRHRENDLVVDDIFVSRIHARIEYRKGRFFVVDTSTNGTYLLPRERKASASTGTSTPFRGKASLASAERWTRSRLWSSTLAVSRSRCVREDESKGREPEVGSGAERTDSMKVS
jgi:hypothetical protein